MPVILLPFQIMPYGARNCHFMWTVDILPDEDCAEVKRLTGLRPIAATLEG